MNCPICGKKAFVLATSAECSTPGCQNYKANSRFGQGRARSFSHAHWASDGYHGSGMYSADGQLLAPGGRYAMVIGKLHAAGITHVCTDYGQEKTLKEWAKHYRTGHNWNDEETKWINDVLNDPTLPEE